MTGLAGVVLAEASASLTFQTHGAFFSKETHTSPALDPQVFVADATAVAGVGPQSIEHLAGLRPLRLDEENVALYTADAVGLGFTSSKWLAAEGTAKLAQREISLHFSRLIVFGVYSLFKNTFSSSGVTFAPLDGEGTRNSFKADAAGSASLTVTTPESLTNRNAILLVYHSDGTDHGAQRGKIGFTAHHHLIAPLS
ncbi:MAG: hypothetical protein JO359_07525 [Candidatus Eremiobacteraeota bacterium]|nr:hypothetical protein [Candidatus Eremiobacteraeota bacterium]